MTRLRVDPGILEDAIRQALASGLKLHCWDVDARPMWLSEDADERAEAAAQCEGCPTLDPCRDEGRSHQYGVWGAVDRTRAGWSE